MYFGLYGAHIVDVNQIGQISFQHNQARKLREASYVKKFDGSLR
jgi:hypothetical protein